MFKELSDKQNGVQGLKVEGAVATMECGDLYAKSLYAQCLDAHAMLGASGPA